jgi:hypothetical protein
MQLTGIVASELAATSTVVVLLSANQLLGVL